MTEQTESLKLAIAWADFHGQAVFAGGGMNAVNGMNEWRTALAEVLATPPLPVQPVARVAEVHMSRYTLEWTNGPLPEGTELFSALAPLPVQEPVARVIDNGTPEGATEWIPFTNRVEPLETGDLLYTTPPLPVQPAQGLGEAAIRADEREKVVKFIQDYPRWLGDNAIREIIEAIRARGNT